MRCTKILSFHTIFGKQLIKTSLEMKNVKYFGIKKNLLKTSNNLRMRISQIISMNIINLP